MKKSLTVGRIVLALALLAVLISRAGRLDIPIYLFFVAAVAVVVALVMVVDAAPQRRGGVEPLLRIGSHRGDEPSAIPLRALHSLINEASRHEVAADKRLRPRLSVLADATLARFGTSLANEARAKAVLGDTNHAVLTGSGPIPMAALRGLLDQLVRLDEQDHT